jgi:pimeloyl-ACP methyl ester carboxylesterase
MTATIVLVHGGWAGSWIWKYVVAELEGRGIPNVAVDLPTCNATSPTVDFHDDARYVRGVIDEVGGPVVVAANSYGGLVMTEAADAHPAVRHLVYIAAFMPSPEESLMQVAAEAPNPDMNALITRRPDGLFDIDFEADIEFSLQQAPPEVVEFVLENSGKPMSLQGMDGAVSGAAWRSIPSTYVVCTEDKALRPDAQREWAKTRATNYVEWPSDHCPQLSRPGDVADVLVDLAAESAQAPRP